MPEYITKKSLQYATVVALAISTYFATLQTQGIFTVQEILPKAMGIVAGRLIVLYIIAAVGYRLIGKEREHTGYTTIPALAASSILILVVAIGSAVSAVETQDPIGYIGYVSTVFTIIQIWIYGFIGTLLKKTIEKFQATTG